MTYLSLDEAKQSLSRVLNAYDDKNKNLDESYLERSIDEVEAIVNASITNRYTIPATSTEAISFLRSLVIAILKQLYQIEKFQKLSKEHTKVL